MQAVQRKTEYRPSPTKKRVVKIEGNVAYIKTGHQKGKAAHNPKSQAAKRPGALNGDPAKRSGSSVVSSTVKQSVRKPAASASKAKQAHTGVASTMIVIFIAFCALALLVSRYAAVCIIDSENNKLKNDIKSVEARIEELKVDMEISSDLEYVRNTAISKLGMTYPEQSQRIRLDMS